MKIPKYSQHLDVEDKKWKERACGIISLKMAMEGHKENIPPADELIKKGLEMDAYLKGVGWKHKELAQLAQTFGFKSKNFDWNDLSSEEAWEEMEKYFPRSPVIVSVYKNLDPKKESGHLILLTQKNGDDITYHEPDAKNRSSIEKTVSKNKFLEGWKRRIIVVKPE